MLMAFEMEHNGLSFKINGPLILPNIIGVNLFKASKNHFLYYFCMIEKALSNT